MSEEKIDQLLEGMNELRLVTRAILDRQDETDAKLEALTMEAHQLKGEVAELKHDVAVLKQDVAELKQDVALLKQDMADVKDGQDRHITFDGMGAMDDGHLPPALPARLLAQLVEAKRIPLQRTQGKRFQHAFVAVLAVFDICPVLFEQGDGFVLFSHVLLEPS
ncbi:UNVERIFIED_CONTAM: hypothetical protein PO554_26320 [Klebsiella pneumoniae]